MAFTTKPALSDTFGRLTFLEQLGLWSKGKFRPLPKTQAELEFEAEKLDRPRDLTTLDLDSK